MSFKRGGDVDHFTARVINFHKRELCGLLSSSLPLWYARRALLVNQSQPGYADKKSSFFVFTGKLKEVLGVEETGAVKGFYSPFFCGGKIGQNAGREKITQLNSVFLGLHTGWSEEEMLC